MRRRKLLVALSLALVILLAAFLRFYQLGATSIGNTYYAATVQSMLISWHNFFYAAFEPGGSVTVDKPPLGFWIQAASAYIFGVNGFSLALPQALAGVLSVVLLYFLVRRHFGQGVGILSALALAVTPVSVSTERNNTIDGLLVLVLLLAVWAFFEAVHKGKLRFLFLGVFIVGLGFNIKMLQAYMPLPALYAIYFFGMGKVWWKRLLHLFSATVVLLAVSLSWALIVDLTPADQRPYIGSSSDNTVLGLIAGHNGLSRLISMRPFTGRVSPGAPRSANNPGAGPFQPQPPPGQLPIVPGPGIPPAARLPQGTSPQAPLPFPPDDGQPGNRNQEVGEAGWLRLFTEPLATEASWVLPLALLGILLALIVLDLRPPLRGKRLAILLWAGWLLPEWLYFTFTTGIFHAYYLIMLGPPLAALTGITAWSLWRTLQRRRRLGWTVVVLLSGATLAFQIVTLRQYPHNSSWIIAFSMPLWLVGIGLLPWKAPPWFIKVALALVCLSLIVAPLAWSILTAFNRSPDVMLPNPGPNEARGPQTISPELLSPAERILLEYLLANTNSQSYLVATFNARQAAPYILATLRPVLTFGGFSGTDSIVDVRGLTQMVAAGELRFVLNEPEFQRQKPEIAAWLQRRCSIVHLPAPSRNVTPHQPGPVVDIPTLFDCGMGR